MGRFSLSNQYRMQDVGITKGPVRDRQCGCFSLPRLQLLSPAPLPRHSCNAQTALEVMRKRYDFVVCGYVVMPEHVHFLVSEPKKALLSKAIQALKLPVPIS